MAATARSSGAGVPLSLLLYAPRSRVRATIRGGFPRRRGRIIVARSADEVRAALHGQLVDAVLIDAGTASQEMLKIAPLARDYPSAPFFALMALRAADGPALARCVEFGFADVLIDGVDDAAARELILSRCFSTRFLQALEEPPAQLLLSSPMQRKAWRCVVAHGGRAVRTETLAVAVGVTREHLSRCFAADGAPNLKRVIDLVRLIAAAELAKNPGYDIRDVAKVLGFASASHLSSTAQRVTGTKPASLARLRAIDLIDRFAKSGTRSRA